MEPRKPAIRQSAVPAASRRVACRTRNDSERCDSGGGPAEAISAEEDRFSQSEAQSLLRDVVKFYRSRVGHEGAYLWRYAADLSAQEGEGSASATSGWTQPPGTPHVGEAYLEAWRLTGEQSCLDAAVEAAHALVRAQLVSGGWSAHFDLEPPGRRRYAYRVDGDDRGGRNRTTFDDNKTQSALMLLMHVDEELDFRDGKIHEAVTYALDRMLEAQYPNGAWPQQYSKPPDDDQYPVRQASYPETWSRTYPGKNYVGYYTLNDNNMSHIVDMFFEADRIYDRPDCFDAAVHTGDFFLAAQMPDPQPGWAQQYNLKVHPAWARKFEPPAMPGGEAQSVMRTLLRLYRFTADEENIYVQSSAGVLTTFNAENGRRLSALSRNCVASCGGGRLANPCPGDP